MKEATGELNMTVVTIIFIGLILTFFTGFWGTIQKKIQKQWNISTESPKPTTTPTPAKP